MPDPRDLTLATLAVFVIIGHIFSGCRAGGWLLGSPSRLKHALFWALPLVVAGLSAFLMWLAGMEKAPFVLAACFLPLFYVQQVLLWGFVFRCRRCGVVDVRWRHWWRKGAHWCPRCGTPYINGR